MLIFQTSRTARLFYVCLLILGLCASRLHAQQANPDEEDEENNMEELNEDESSGHYNEEEKTPVGKQSTLTQNAPIRQNLDKPFEFEQKSSTQSFKHVDDTGDDANNQNQQIGGNVQNDLYDGDIGDEQNQNEDDLDDSEDNESIVKANNEVNPGQASGGLQPQSTQVSYHSSRSKLINIITKPGILAGIVGGAIIGILTAILLIMFIVYRMRKKDEGSYALEETKKPLNAYDYRHCPTKEFYA